MNNKKLDIFPDTEISYNMENPFVTADKVPVPYTLDFLLPKTAENLAALGQPERVSSLVNFAESRNVEVRFCGFPVIIGELVIMEVNQEGVQVNITGANIPKRIKKKLYDQELGEVGFSYAISMDNGAEIIDTYGTKLAINDHFEAKAKENMPDYVAAPCAVKGVEPVVANPDGYSDFFADRYINQRCGMVNNYRHELGMMPADQHTSAYYGYYCTSKTGVIMTKIIPAFRIGYLLKKLLNVSFTNNVFDEELGRLMLLCNYHPKYQADDDSIVGDVDRSTMEIKMRFADFMPDINANEFLTEILKIPCLTLFIRGSQYDIEFNDDILTSEQVVRMNLVDGYAISLQMGERYKFDLSSDSQQDESTENAKVFNVSGIGTAYQHAIAYEYDPEVTTALTYNISDTDQVFRATPIEELSQIYLESTLNFKCRTHWRFKLLQQGTQQTEEEEDDDRGTFDMSFNGSVCNTVIVDYLDDDGSYKPTFRGKNEVSVIPHLYVPEIAFEKKEDKLIRNSKIVLGLYLGISDGLPNPHCRIKYPQISHCSNLPGVGEITDVKLTSEYLLSKYHSRYKAWIERDKKVIAGSVILTPQELHQLDLRRKVHIDGRNFFIKNINIVLTNSQILPSEVEFIEA